MVLIRSASTPFGDGGAGERGEREGGIEKMEKEREREEVNNHIL